MNKIKFNSRSEASLWYLLLVSQLKALGYSAKNQCDISKKLNKSVLNNILSVFLQNLRVFTLIMATYSSNVRLRSPSIFFYYSNDHFLPLFKISNEGFPSGHEENMDDLWTPWCYAYLNRNPKIICLSWVNYFQTMSIGWHVWHTSVIPVNGIRGS